MQDCVPDAASWRELAATVGAMPTQDDDWMRSAVRHTAEPHDVRVFARCRRGQLVSVAPLVMTQGHWQLAGSATLFEPGDLLARDEAALADLVGRVLRTGRPLLLRRVPEGSPTPEVLARVVGGRGRVVTREAAGAPYVDLDERWDELGGGLSSRRRADLRRARRRAEQRGEVGVEVSRPTAAEVPALVDVLVEVEARSWKGSSGTALAHDRLRGPFFRDYAVRAAEHGQLLMAFLRIDGRVAATQLCVVWGERLWVLKIGYDAEFSSCSPGVLLLAHVVQAARQRGLRSVELLGDAEPWLQPWQSGVRATRNVVVYPWHPMALPGAAYVAARASATVATRAWHDAVTRVQGRFVAGDTLADAVRVESRCAERGFPTVIGYWHTLEDRPESVLASYQDTVQALRSRDDAQVSVKMPALGGRRALLEELVEPARAAGVGLHLDAMGEDDQSGALADAFALAARLPGGVGVTLPGRWSRSRTDAAEAATHGVRVRVVKGEWGEVAPGHDDRAAFLAVVGALARARPLQVQVATHDAALLRVALDVLGSAGVPCEHQVLYGMSSGAALRVARHEGVATRVLVPWGQGRVPYGLRNVTRRPAVAVRLARDLATGTRPL